MLKYNSESRKISSTFKAYRNDITIYTEDEEKDKEFYTQLLKRILGDRVMINDITPLGCKDNVIKYCFESNHLKCEAYIIDGDIKIVNDNQKISHPKLFILDRYCIENYLIDENSTIKYIYNNVGTQSEAKIKESLNFDEWLLSFSEPFTNLFIHFAISDYFDIPYTLFNSIKYFAVKKNSITFNPKLIEDDVNLLKNEAIRVKGEYEYSKLLKILESKWQPNLDTLLKIVSGKNYLIPLLQLKTKEFKKIKSSETLEVCKINLVQHFDVTKLDNLKIFIENLVSHKAS